MDNDTGHMSKTDRPDGKTPRSGERGAAPRSQPQLPLDTDERIGYVLTARARREVAPDTLPDLTVVPGSEDPHSPLRARARALRRSGRSVADIADALGVDADSVASWCEGVQPRWRRATSGPRPARGPDPRLRAVARMRAAEVLSGEDALRDAAVAGLVAAAAVVTADAVSVTPPHPELAIQIAVWLRDSAGADPVKIRALVAAGPGAARDILAEEWAGRLGLERGAVTHAPWRDAPAPLDVRVTVRCADPVAAATVAGWIDAIRELSGTAVGHDVEPPVGTAS